MLRLRLANHRRNKYWSILACRLRPIFNIIMASLMLGQGFSKMEDCIEFVENYFKINYQPMKKDTKESVSNFIKKCRSDGAKVIDLAPDAQYSQKWICKHFGNIKKANENKRTGARPNQFSYLCGCSARVYVAYCKIRKEYIVKTLCLQHNHPIDEKLYSMYPDNRRPNEPALQQAKDMLNAGADATLVTSFLQNLKFQVSRKDVYNIKQQLRSNIDKLKAALDEPGTHSEIVADDKGTLTCVSFYTEFQKELAYKYGSIVLMGRDYKINRFSMTLYTLAIVDGEGHGQPIAHSLLRREDEEHVMMFFNFITKQMPGICNNSIFIMDNDYAKTNAISKAFPNASIHLSRIHVLKVFLEEMEKQGLHYSRDLHRHLTKLVYCDTKEIFFDTLIEILKEFPAFHAYLTANWLGEPELFAGYARVGKWHSDIHTTYHLERFYLSIKAVVKSSKSSISSLVKDLLQLASVPLSLRHSNSNSMLQNPSAWPKYLNEYRQYLSQFALELILKEHAKSTTVDKIKEHLPCNCDFITDYRLPCRHYLATLNENDEEYAINDDGWMSEMIFHNTSTPTSIKPTEVSHKMDTQQRRFEAAMVSCSLIASALSELPPATFSKALAWLQSLEVRAKDGSWEESTSIDRFHQPAVTVTDSLPVAMASLDQPDTRNNPSATCSSVATVALQYPLAVKPKERHHKRKQPLSHEHKLPFEKLHSSRQDMLRIKWLTSEGVSEKCISSGYVAVIEDVASRIDTRCFDERASIGSARQYFTDEAWLKIEDIICKAKAEMKHCSECGYNTNKNNKTKWVQCDSCLLWRHCSCVRLKRTPKGIWFCEDCQ